jgi:hypothetical protein
MAVDLTNDHVGFQVVALLEYAAGASSTQPTHGYLRQPPTPAKEVPSRSRTSTSSSDRKPGKIRRSPRHPRP